MGELDNLNQVKSSFPIIKVGYSSNWSKRKQAYRNGYYSLKEYTQPFGDLQDEDTIHEFLKDYRIFKKEWYKYDPNIVGWFINLTPVLLGDLRSRLCPTQARGIGKKEFQKTSLSRLISWESAKDLPDLESLCAKFEIPDDDLESIGHFLRGTKDKIKFLRDL